MKQTLLMILAIAMCCSFSTQSSSKVYICTGPQSKRYHKTANCRGLGSCSGEIKAVTVEYARKIGRTPCGWCYK